MSRHLTARVSGRLVSASNILEMMVALVSEVAGTTLFAYVIGALVSIVLNLDPQDRLRKQQVSSKRPRRGDRRREEREAESCART